MQINHANAACSQVPQIPFHQYFLGVRMVPTRIQEAVEYQQRYLVQKPVRWSCILVEEKDIEGWVGEETK